MATVTLRRTDLWPVGTTVGIYPGGSVPADVTTHPTQLSLATAVIDAAGLLTVTDAAILSYTDYVAAAADAAGTWHYARCRSTLDIQERGIVTGTLDIDETAVATNAVATVGSFQIGQRLSGTGIRPGTLIQNVVGGTLALSQTASATATGVAVQGEGGLRWKATIMRRRAAIGTLP
jgi:hypothetical protein